MTPVLFEDRIVSSSDLNRRSGEVLRTAEQYPVTIVRAAGDLVLMRRGFAADLMRSATAAQVLLELSSAMIDRNQDASWVRSLDLSDLADALQEVADVYRRSTSTGEQLNEVRTVLREWRKSFRWSQNAEVAAQVQEATEAYERDGGIPLDDDGDQ